MTRVKTHFHVHVYREMRLYYPGIHAESFEVAARFASERPTNEAESIEDCDGETLSALVDVDGDSEYSTSHVIDFREPRRSELLQALRSLETALHHHAHWLPTMPAHLACAVRQAVTLAQTL